MQERVAEEGRCGHGRLSTHKNLIDACEDNLLAKRDGNIAKRYRNNNVPPESINQKYTLSKSRLDKVETELDVARKNYSNELSKKIEGLLVKQLGVLEKFKGKDIGIIENLNKIEWAHTKIKECKGDILKTLEKSKLTLKAVESLGNILNIFQESSKSFEFYQTFLEDVVMSEQTRSESLEDLVNYHRSLYHSHDDLSDKFSESVKELESSREEVLKKIKQMTEKLLGGVHKFKKAEEEILSLKTTAEHLKERIVALRIATNKKMVSFELVKNFINTILRNLIKTEEAPSNALKLPVYVQFQIIRTHILLLKRTSMSRGKSFLKIRRNKL